MPASSWRSPIRTLDSYAPISAVIATLVAAGTAVLVARQATELRVVEAGPTGGGEAYGTRTRCA